MAASSRFGGHGPLLLGLAMTRIIGWGSTFYSPSVLVGALDREIGLNAEIVFGGITILLVTGALVAPAIGRVLDREGTRRSMCIGAVICALGLGVLSQAQGPMSYLASWSVIGLGHAMSLANTGNVTISQLMGDRTRRVIGKAEYTEKGDNPRFIVTSLGARAFPAQMLYEDVYCARGDMENRIKEQQLDLFADRTSTATLRANQFRLWLSSVAYCFLNDLRELGLAGTRLAKAQCGTIRTRLMKIGALVCVSVRRVLVRMAESCPFQDVFVDALLALRALPRAVL